MWHRSASEEEQSHGLTEEVEEEGEEEDSAEQQGRAVGKKRKYMG